MPTDLNSKYVSARWYPFVVYRIVRSNPTSLADVETTSEKNRRINRSYPKWTDRQRLMAEGISVYETRERAEMSALDGRGRLGVFVAAISLPVVGVAMELTGAEGRWTLWENLESLLPKMHDVVRVPGL